METFLILIPVTLALVALSLWAFVWSARNGQFEDIDRQAWSILFDNTAEEHEARLHEAGVHEAEVQEPQADPLGDGRPEIEAGAPQDAAERDGRAQ